MNNPSIYTYDDKPLRLSPMVSILYFFKQLKNNDNELYINITNINSDKPLDENKGNIFLNEYIFY